MTKKTLQPVELALAVLILAGACTLVPSWLLPAPTATPTAAATASPGPSLPRDLAPTPTPVDLEACAARLVQGLADAPYTIGMDELRDIYRLVLYHVGSDALSQPEYGFAPENLQSFQGDTARHEEIWRLAAGLIPDEERRRLRYFLIYTDGAGDSLAAVRQIGSPYYWTLAVDIQDAGDADLLSASLVHELGHLATLNSEQVVPDQDLFDNPTDEHVYRQARAACENYFTLTGCSRLNSYMNLFFQRFWPNIYNQWLDAVESTSESAYLSGLEDIYDEHPDDFVTEYAVSSPEEDIAESFLYFALSPRPAGDSVVEQKIDFFYGFSALVDMRERILQHLCAPADGP